ncbi:sterol desaturase family protein [Tahibacter amnicola]|uniref:Sterol desaturase family protein n=1 Tax=Tahibacter amnicola TaxID=2976241 RepID=A0ABY6BJP8_9GAMM|nr:sterol desaturase family protein [Tahibacter amnicola]UXI68022.1 sterol desaturase family protein [Tahibacter amnicola]
MNPIVYAIPVFFLLMGIEALVARARGRRVYRIGDAVSSIGLGAVSQVTGVFSKVMMVGIYVWVYEQGHWLDLSASSVWVWLIGLLIYDFLYYWHHRLGHEVAVLWAAHVVHHQSEEFNLSTALRQTSSGFLLGWVFYLPMALLGFPPLVFVAVGLIDLLYQYWIHTEQVGRLGWFDRVFASPSNHRVHHGVNDVYLDKNYGGILIVWDRLFGTFIEEDDKEPVIYGTRAPLRRFDPIWANLEVYAALAFDAWHARRWRDKFLVWIKPPGWRPDDVAARFPKPGFDPHARAKYDPPTSPALRRYAFVQFALLMVAGMDFLARADGMSLGGSGLYAAWLVVSLVALTGLLENRRPWWLIETGRLVFAAVLAGWSSAWFGLPLSRVSLALIVMTLGLSLAGALVVALRPRAASTQSFA